MAAGSDQLDRIFKLVEHIMIETHGMGLPIVKSGKVDWMYEPVSRDENGPISCFRMFIAGFRRGRVSGCRVEADE